MPWLLKMTVLVSALMAPAALYLCFRLFNILKKGGKHLAFLKWLMPLVLCSFYLFPLVGAIDFYTTGSIDLLGYPKILAYWFWFGLIFVFQLVTWVLVADLLKFGSRLLSSSYKAVEQWYPRFIAGVIIIVFIFVGWKMYQDTTRVRTDSRSLAIKGLPPSLEDFKIVHISDIQGDEYTGRDEIANYIDVVNRQNPDLIIFTGDLISYGTDFISMAARELGKAKATYGTVAVVGDHDYWAGTNTVENALEEEGVTLLRDENYTIKLDTGDSLAITGVTEVYSKASNPKTVDSLTHNLPEASVKILGSHQVEDHLITNARQNNYDMMLAGHTHGGQIHVPFLGMSFSAAERETQYVSGLYREGALPIHINNGLGFTLGPIRYGAPPTVTSIRLKKE
ncbi:metallophosphoesterase [Fodinibius halophilus]|uniref:Calcineurin-like phosphoesterase domain-containing protein n=1 Tax=Fodinibius halophilus TaxID=1736908 RepID=A0A6M1TLP2_9BACT|nr:hypothetical protein [Fodinibius halophilus]